MKDYERNVWLAVDGGVCALSQEYYAYTYNIASYIGRPESYSHINTVGTACWPVPKTVGFLNDLARKLRLAAASTPPAGGKE